MPNIKSAKKRVLVIEKKTMQNKAIKSALKTQVKKFLAAVEAGDKELATKLLSEVTSLVDSAASKNIIHKSNADRKKSRLSLYMSKKCPAVEDIFWFFVLDCRIEV